MSHKTLEKEAIRTLLFFNLHRRPLSLKEIHQFLGAKTSEAELFLALMKLVRKGTVIEKNHQFALKKFQNIFRNLTKRQKIKNSLLKKAQRFAWVFKIVPFVRGVFLTNSLALGLPSEKSDIDVVVLTKPNRLWTARFFLNLWFLLLGQRRRRKFRKDPARFCLSYFVDLKKANLKFLKLREDPLLIYWLATLAPLVGTPACYYFWHKNDWTKTHLPNLFLPQKNDKIKPLSFLAFLQEKLLDLFGNWLEQYLYSWQTKRIKAKNQKDTNFASKSLYKIHPEGGRKKIALRLKRELRKLQSTS